MTDKPRFRPFVPEGTQMREFTLRAVLLGLVMTVILGAANAYLGLRAGITIAATYPAAVIGMAVLKVWRGSILEENIARTAGSIGESVAAGAIFTIPAFVIAGAWSSFRPEDAYWKATALMMVGSILGVLFVSLVRRVMVEDPELPFPESVAASEIHKAGQRGAEAAKFLFYNIGIGGAIYLLSRFQLFASDMDISFPIGLIGKSRVRLGALGSTNFINSGGGSAVAAPSVSPAYLGVGYIIGVKLAALQFSGGVLAWGLMVPLIIFLLGPDLQKFLPAGSGDNWTAVAASVWRFIVRPIAVGGMLVGAAYTLFKMRASLTTGISRALKEVRHPPAPETLQRTERYMSSKIVFSLIGIMFLLMLVLYYYLSGVLLVAVVAGVVMLVMGFFFATVSGNLVGMIGSSNNPISGLTLSTLLIAALLLVSMGVSGMGGVATVLGVAAVVCVSSAVAGELLQDFKVGYILGGTPRYIQITELIAVVVASAVMYWPLLLLHEGNIRAGGIGFGDRQLSAPQAGLMAVLAQGIVGGDMPWPLVCVGIVMGIAMIMMQVKSPMLVSVGMYLPIETTFAIFIGGVIRWIADWMTRRRGYNEGQTIRVENAGVLTASGLIAGEAILGLVWAALQFAPQQMPKIFEHPSYLAGLGVMLLLAYIMVKMPLSSAGSPDEPAPPTAMM